MLSKSHVSNFHLSHIHECFVRFGNFSLLYERDQDTRRLIALPCRTFALPLFCAQHTHTAGEGNGFLDPPIMCLRSGQSEPDRRKSTRRFRFMAHIWRLEDIGSDVAKKLIHVHLFMFFQTIYVIYMFAIYVIFGQLTIQTTL